jgi:hypothetical protein
MDTYKQDVNPLAETSLWSCSHNYPKSAFPTHHPPLKYDPNLAKLLEIP